MSGTSSRMSTRPASALVAASDTPGAGAAAGSAAGSAMKCSCSARLTAVRNASSPRLPLVITTKPYFFSASKNIEL